MHYSVAVTAAFAALVAASGMDLDKHDLPTQCKNYGACGRFYYQASACPRDSDKFDSFIDDKKYMRCVCANEAREDLQECYKGCVVKHDTEDEDGHTPGSDLRDANKYCRKHPSHEDLYPHHGNERPPTDFTNPIPNGQITPENCVGIQCNIFRVSANPNAIKNDDGTGP